MKFEYIAKWHNICIESNHRKKKPYENVIGIATLCSILLPDQDYFEVALYLQPNSSQLNQSIWICCKRFCDWGERQNNFVYDMHKD